MTTDAAGHATANATYRQLVEDIISAGSDLEMERLASTFENVYMRDDAQSRYSDDVNLALSNLECEAYECPPIAHDYLLDMVATKTQVQAMAARCLDRLKE